jgi:uncharacterized membrane protein
MPAIMIRQLEALAKVIEQTPDRVRRTVLIREADAIQRLNLATVAEPTDRDDVTRRYEIVMALVDPNAPPRLAEVKPISDGLGNGKAAPAV